jgi:UDP:flavonoid glycosyltransferase YjiC (YdhE family)
MSRVLFVTWDGGGNVAPAELIAGELRRRGHDVRFLGQAQQRERIEALGFGFAAYSRPGPWTAVGTRNAVTNAVGFLRLLAGRSLGRDLLADLAAHPADLVVVDCLLFGALHAAVRSGVAHAVLVHSLFGAVDAKMAQGTPGVVARLAGLNPWRLWSRAGAMVVTTVAELDLPAGRRWPALSYTGPVLAAPTRELSSTPSTPSTPIILVSLSTTYISGQHEVLGRILDAVGAVTARVIVTTGPALDPDDLRVPDNAEVHRFSPHADLMPTVSLVIGHGGHSTTALALAHDVPLVILPMNPAFDQPLIGRRVHELGAGIALGRSASVSQIRDATRRVLSEPTYHAAAARLGAAIRTTDGASTAATLLESLSDSSVPRDARPTR